ncbi:MAG: PqqD family protein [Rhodocyclaceae bacterium]|nr:PqqD family protein [Rhodocyclaceae bacterium]
MRSSEKPLVDLPSSAALDRIAVSESGFVFDPTTGDSYTVNATGLVLLKLFRQTRDLEALVAAVLAEHEVGAERAERDILEFAGALRQHLRT